MTLNGRRYKVSMIALVLLLCVVGEFSSSSARMLEPVQLLVTEGWPEEGPWVNEQIPPRTTDVTPAAEPKSAAVIDVTAPIELDLKSRVLSLLHRVLRVVER